MRSVIFSQCRDRRMGVVWLNLGASTTARATARTTIGLLVGAGVAGCNRSDRRPWHGPPATAPGLWQHRGRERCPRWRLECRATGRRGSRPCLQADSSRAITAVSSPPYGERHNKEESYRENGSSDSYTEPLCPVSPYVPCATFLDRLDSKILILETHVVQPTTKSYQK